MLNNFVLFTFNPKFVSNPNSMKKNLIYSFFFLISYSASSQSLFLNEVMSNNIRLVDDQGENEDWIEIYNASSATIDLSNYYLTDDFSEPDEWQFPPETYILPNDFLLIWADDDVSENDHLHCSFKLSKEGEGLFLMQKVGNEYILIDELEIPALSENSSYGRTSDGATDFAVFGKYSPAYSNNDNLPFSEEKVRFSLVPGFYSGGTELSLSTSIPNAQIHYTTDGKRPDENDVLYTGESIILDSTMYIRATACIPGYAPSVPSEGFFLIDKNYDIPVVHVGTDSINLWNDYAGIYTTGRGGINVYCSNQRRNWNQSWKRRSEVTFFETDGDIGFVKSADIKISGNCSRGHKMKSIGVSLNDDATTEYPLFDHLPYTNYRQFKLRNSGNDSESTMMRDGALQTILQGEVDMDLMAYRPVVLYINGVYFGVYGLREVMNEKYVKLHHEVDNGDVLNNRWSVFPGIIDGDTENWDALSDWMTASDLSVPENYEYFKSQVDIDPFINYFLSEMYIANYDWPGNNMRMWRDRDDPNSKWRWLLFDTDVSSNFEEQGWSCSTVSCNYLRHCLAEDSEFFSNRPASTEWLIKLVQNTEFSNELVQRHCTFAQTIFAPERAEYYIDSLANLLRPEVPTHIEHWLNAPEEMGETEWIPGGGSLADWEERIDRFKFFFTKRFEHTLTHFGLRFNIWNHFKLQINVEDSQQGKVVLHENKMAVSPDYLGKYFANIPMRVEAVPAEGYRFVKWEETESFEAVFYLNSNQNQTITPIFVKEEDYFEPLNENAGVDMRIFPNPASGALNFIIAYGRTSEASLTISNALGQIVHQDKLGIERHPKWRIINLNNWQTGIYFFRLVVEGEEFVERVVVQ